MSANSLEAKIDWANVPATPVQLDYICVWSDGMYCSPDELNTMTHRSDDYARVAVGPDEDEAVVAQAYADQANKAFTSVMQALGAASVQGASILEQHWG